MSRQRETKGLGDDYYRHYQSKRDYYKEAKDAANIVKKKSRRISYLNIFILVIIFLLVNFFQKKEKSYTITPLPSFITYDIASYYSEGKASLSLLLKPTNLNEFIVPFSISLAWQNPYNIFARYDIIDDSLWDEAKEGYYLFHEEEALVGATLYITIVKEGNEAIIIIKKID